MKGSEWSNFLVEYNVFLRSVLIIILTVIVLYFYIRSKRKLRRDRINGGEHADAKATVYNTVQKNSVQTLKEAGVVIILIISMIMILYVNGVDVTAGLAGLGIAGTIIGLAMQDFLKDSIMGLRIARDHFFEVGDVVRIHGITGVVVEFSMRNTKIENIENHSVYTVCNGQITDIERMSHLLDILIPFPYDIDHATAKKAVFKICARAWMINGIENCYYKGVYEFAESAVEYKLRCFCKPDYHPDMRLRIQAIIREVFDEMGIEIPFRQVDVHMK